MKLRLELNKDKRLKHMNTTMITDMDMSMDTEATTMILNMLPIKKKNPYILEKNTQKIKNNL